MRALAIALLVGAAAPAMAQDHSGHTMPAAPAAAQTDCEKEAARHRAMGHPVPADACAVAAAAVDSKPTSASDHSEMDHSKMDHSTMDHGSMQGMDHGTMDHGSTQGMDHSQMGHGATEREPIPVLPPPAAAGSGPPRAADAIWGADGMRPSRDNLRDENGGMTWFWFQGDRFEYRAREGHDGYLWDIQGYYGGDIDKLWFKSEGEGAFGEEVESADIQALWSHAIGPWWDVQAGIRQDLTGAERTHAVIGVQGMAPYLFEIDAAAFLSTKGDLTASIEAELDQRITQRLILQPRAEASLSAQNVPELGIGAGLDSIEAGIRLRYEFAREFAPYMGIEQEWKFGRSADYARLAGEDPSVTNFVVGVRFWF